ncbi:MULTISPECIES: DinB family protein [Burkholderia]|uniref:DinB family protein n=1 Tax=Burkholderia TaxID=32008 RepID=UPI0006A5F0EB|nr:MULTISPECIES: DinB family protein [Burkholderia]KOE27206.1 damage-inducible protein DinB [Burkholderia multivorans R-20526]MBU9245312.1 DinB family protein [Burkholderia multivorans]MCA8476842.1 DinB family protein [Burkholderia multivorans]MCO7334593.1 DinB family protein [Burkholderia multivorans]MCO7342385.1 DinB family protein [Burkholderia multivorans]
MNPTTLDALADFPRLLEAHFAAVPDGYARWTPDDWTGIPSERFSPLGQLCHVRDIEIDGYHVRLQRMLDEDRPLLVSVDGDALAIERRYDAAYASDVLATFRDARRTTLEIVSRLTPEQFARTGEFEGYGPLTVRGLLHYLCSHDQQHLAGMQWLLGKIDAQRHAR